MTWKDSFLIGFPEIDKQHKELCEKIDDLYDACSRGKGADEVLKTLDFLESYTIRHFAEEEKLQREIHYPKFPQHKELHANFVGKIAQMKKEMISSGAHDPHGHQNQPDDIRLADQPHHAG